MRGAMIEGRSLQISQDGFIFLSWKGYGMFMLGT
jgi:hypothetical protein